MPFCTWKVVFERLRWACVQWFSFVNKLKKVTRRALCVERTSRSWVWLRNSWSLRNIFSVIKNESGKVWWKLSEKDVVRFKQKWLQKKVLLSKKKWTHENVSHNPTTYHWTNFCFRSLRSLIGWGHLLFAYFAWSYDFQMLVILRLCIFSCTFES